MKKEDDLNRKTLLTLGLLVVFMLSACTPPTTSAPPAPPTQTPEAQSANLPEAATAVPAAEAVVEAEPPTEEVVVQPTSRGNELEATDPATVNLVSGQPQLFEFFAFW